MNPEYDPLEDGPSDAAHLPDALPNVPFKKHTMNPPTTPSNAGSSVQNEPGKPTLSPVTDALAVTHGQDVEGYLLEKIPPSAFWTAINLSREFEEKHTALDARVKELEGNLIPCCDCRAPVTEFVIPNEVWNGLVRRGGPETDEEYLCVQCFGARAGDTLRETISELEALRAKLAEAEKKSEFLGAAARIYQTGNAALEAERDEWKQRTQDARNHMFFQAQKARAAFMAYSSQGHACECRNACQSVFHSVETAVPDYGSEIAALEARCRELEADASLTRETAATLAKQVTIANRATKACEEDIRFAEGVLARLKIPTGFEDGNSWDDLDFTERMSILEKEHKLLIAKPAAIDAATQEEGK